MKNQTLLIFMCFVAVLAMGQTVYHKFDAFMQVTPGCPWVNVGYITDSNTAFGADELQFDEVYEASDPNWAVFEIPSDASYCQFRFLTDADADSHVVNIYIAASNVICNVVNARLQKTTEYDSFTLGTILTLTGGTLEGPSSNYYVDTISNADVVLTGVVDDSATNRYAIYTVDMRGWKYLAIMATTLESSTTLGTQIRWY